MQNVFSFKICISLPDYDQPSNQCRNKNFTEDVNEYLIFENLANLVIEIFGERKAASQNW